MVVQPRSSLSSSAVLPSTLESTRGGLDDDRPRPRSVDVDRLSGQRGLPGWLPSASSRHRATCPSARPAIQQGRRRPWTRPRWSCRGPGAGPACQGPVVPDRVQTAALCWHPVREGDHRTTDDHGRAARRRRPGSDLDVPGVGQGAAGRSCAPELPSSSQTAASSPVPSGRTSSRRWPARRGQDHVERPPASPSAEGGEALRVLDQALARPSPARWSSGSSSGRRRAPCPARTRCFRRWPTRPGRRSWRTGCWASGSAASQCRRRPRWPARDARRRSRCAHRPAALPGDGQGGGCRPSGSSTADQSRVRLDAPAPGPRCRPKTPAG